MEQEPLPLQHNRIATPPPPPPASHNHHHTAFYWRKEAWFLFSGWPGNNSGRYALALIFVFILAILVEVLSDLDFSVGPGKNWFWAETAQAGTHAVRAGFTYMVILAVMSYNGGVFVVAVLGHAVGYVIFGSVVSYRQRHIL